MVSLLIETTQGTGIFGLYPCPYRLADVDDLLTNTLGAVIGWCIGAGARRAWPFVPPPARVDLKPPTGRRRLAAAFVDVSLVVLMGAGSSVVLTLFAAVRGEKGTSLQILADVLQVGVTVVGGGAVRAALAADHHLGPVALALVTLVELVTIWVRCDDRSLSSVLTRTVTRTHDDIGRRDQKAAEQRAAEQRPLRKRHDGATGRDVALKHGPARPAARPE
ncbi:hypothetical protein BA895_21635 [Humibacillus sp. DSM 29435]|uniref:VanZ family protein n=1 Tax=Humibacillus sp. DSM 29435 TaxID=1869167 RepID=UPI0008726543|nr:VanZ family protein [Humibacillus sp. DSM 29435]OFE15721.1 hypothetical protein BA895_21635 [Humibacillus sp. DSM 29435]